MNTNDRSRPGETRSAEAGAVLVFVVLLMLALVGLGHGILASSLGQLAASSAAARHLMGRAAADGAVNLVIRGARRSWMDSVQVGGVEAIGGLSFGRAEAQGTLRRLAPESWLVEGTGRPRGGAFVRVARLAWALDPLTRVTALPGVVSIGPGAPVTLVGTVDASSWAEVDPPLSNVDCAPWLLELEAHHAGALVPPVATLADTLHGPALGLLDFQSLSTGAEVLVAGSGSPAPMERFGDCVIDEPWGWGDPEHPWRPCGAHLALRLSPGDLDVVGGIGQGLLLVGGDLKLTSGARFYGLVLVQGSLDVGPGASLEGLAVAQRGVHVMAGGRIGGSACWAARALGAQREALGGLIAIPDVAALGPL